jgi:hypothetical protein
MPSNVINVAGIPLCMPVCLAGTSNYSGSSLNLCDLATASGRVTCRVQCCLVRFILFVLFCFVLFCFVLFCFVLLLFCSLLFYYVFFCFVQCNVVYFTELLSGGSRGFCLLEVVQQKPLG